MRQESVIRELVKSYLVELGYPESGMTLEVRTREGRVADLVVHDQDGPRVVVEVKSGKRFPVDKEPSRLRFDPYVRQVQSYATELGAPYYLVTDGESFLWFTTDDSGRPQLLDSPVPPTPGVEAVSLPPSREAILGVLWRLRDLFVRKGTVAGDNEMAIAILAKLLSELGDNRLRETLVTVGDEDSMLLPSVTISPRDLRSHKYLPEALDILDTVSFRDAVPQDVLGALDETLYRTMTRGQPQVPRWLADFLVRLGQLHLHVHAVVLDICTGYGNILAAVSQPQREVHPTSVWGISRDVKSALWAIIQQVILGLPEDRVLVGESPPYDIRDGHRIPRPTHIIAAPPFGGRVGRLDTASALFSEGVVKLEDLYLELAIEWVEPRGRVVMVVPEGLLFTGGKTKVTREFVRERTRISAIISLSRWKF
ncbi:MAG: type I restriction enzyme HsdR N-terminal domain-containing protein [Anaerolineae bacterium]